MSISIIMDWPNGETEIVDLAPSQPVVRGWVPVAERLGHEYTTLIGDFLAVDSGNIDQLFNETVALREAMYNRSQSYNSDIYALDKLLEALSRLRNSSGWSASIG